MDTKKPENTSTRSAEQATKTGTETSQIGSESRDPEEDFSIGEIANGKRKLGNWMFESVGGFYMPTEDVSKLTMQRQEQLLIRDLIYAFSGVPSTHIRPELPVGDISQLRTDQMDKVQFKIEECFSGAFRTLANELLPLIGYYISVQSFIEDTVMTNGCARSLGLAVHKSMQEYFEVQAGLETQLHESKLDLQQLVHQLRPWLSSMECLASLTSRVRTSDLNIAQLMSMMYDYQEHFKCERLKPLLTDVSHHYMKMVQLWTQKGVIYDVRKEFFVEDTSANAMSSTLLSPKQCCYDYWLKRYSLHVERLPNFLEPHIECIFLAGKYLNVLRQCNVQMKLMQSSLTYVHGDQTHVQLIRSSYELPARKLLEVLVQEQHLLQHMRNLQDYFLLEQDEFIEAMLAEFSEYLQANVDSLKPEKLRKMLLRILQDSEDPHKHMLRIHLMECDVATQITNRRKRFKPIRGSQEESEPEPEPEAQAKAVLLPCDVDLENGNLLPEPLSLYGYEAFTLRYEPAWPISLILHEEPLEQLQLLHRVLFYLRYVFQQMSLNTGINIHAEALHERMIDSILQVEQHMRQDIVQPRWKAMMAKAEKAHFVDELVHELETTLDQCQQLCLTSESVTFVRSLFTLGQLCLNFNVFLERKTGEQELLNTLAEYEQEFNTMVMGIMELLAELARPNSSTGDEERTSCQQLLHRFEQVNKRPPTF